MKEIKLFVMASCPYCKKALAWMDELYEETPAYSAIPITIIDEVKQPEIANAHDYYYVPTYYLNNQKVHEGAATREGIKKIFDDALQG